MIVRGPHVVGMAVAVGLAAAAVIAAALAPAVIAPGTVAPDGMAPAIAPPGAGWLEGGVFAVALAIAAGACGMLFLAERRRSAAEIVLQHTIDSVGHGIATFTAGRLAGWNKEFVELLALAPGALATGQPIAEIERVENAGADALLGDLAIQVKRARQGGRPVVVERLRSDGALIALRYSPHAGDGFTIGVSDITASRRTDDYLRRAQKMEALGQMTGGIAHDFNNLLTVVILNLDFLANDTAVAEKQGRRLRLALDAAFRGSKVVRQLLAFTRKQALEPEIVVLAEIMPGLVELVRRALGDAFEVALEGASGLWHTMLDPLQLEAAILNIALNAAAAMPNGGRLTIELANVVLDDAYAARHPEATPGQYVLIALSDTGTGMPADIVARALDPFFTTRPEGHGSGLGLSMVYDFVTQSGGHIRIYSEPGHGTSVKLYFKRSLDDRAARAAGRAVPPAANGRTILIVEDDDHLRATVAVTLQELGYAVLNAPSGSAALILLESSGRVDLLFTDVVMPGPVSSFALVQAAQDLQPAIKILFTSGYTRNAIMPHGRVPSDAHFLSKPFSKAQLADSIRDVLADRSA
jgi:signal transduction histidine kinase/ActR/RegA family two-component response regulator